MAEFTVRRCTTNDIVTTDRFLSRVLFTDEPLLAVNGPHVVPTIDESLSANVIPLGRSVLAETKDGKIVGASLNDPPPQPYPLIYMSTSDDIKFQELFNYMEQVSKINEKSPGALEIRVIAVAEDWRNRGVARDLIKATERIAAEGGFPWVKIYCTSMYTAKLVEKLDWKLLYSMSYEEYANNFPRGMSLPGEPHTHCALYVKEICNKF